MKMEKNRAFGRVITRLIAKNELSKEEAYDAFSMVLNNEVSDMQQGAFLAALTAKGETADEVAGGWKAIYELDTEKVTLTDPDGVVDNCGTGMDTFKTFNISTAAAIVAAGGEVRVARHGARAISSVCGTVDMAEYLGVDVDCSVEVVANSIEQAGLGLFNGMSPRVHPMALGRILSQIHFGSPLNIAASLANPALPKIGARGVYAKELLLPVARVMQSIGYTDAIVVYGSLEGSKKGMDEASVCGTTYCARLENGEINEFTFEPEDCGLPTHTAHELAADKNIANAALKMVALLDGQVPGARTDAVLLNAALIFLVRGTVKTLKDGVEQARGVLAGGKAMETLRRWVAVQNTIPDAGLERLNSLQEEAAAWRSC